MNARFSIEDFLLLLCIVMIGVLLAVIIVNNNAAQTTIKEMTHRADSLQAQVLILDATLKYTR